jgi:glycosyltransferase involved in cell wall biosynthesis
MAIVTDDGTDGERVIRSLNSRIGVLHFWRNGIDQPYIDREKLSFFRKRYGFRPHDLVLIMASRLYSWKRVDRAIKAVQPLIQAKKMKLRLLIVGDGPEKPNLEKLAERLGIKDIVNLAGPIAHKDIYNHYALADVFLSCYDMSNVGNPLWEALNIGKCIVVLNTGKTGDVIKDGVNGLLVEPTLEEENTVQGISQAISRIYNDVKLRKRLALGAKTYGERMLWTWEERLERELASLKKLARKAS